MEILNKEKNEQYRGYRRFLFVLLVAVLMLGSFGSGILLATQNDLIKKVASEKAVYLGELSGKYKKAPEGRLSQDIDFNLFWETWDAIREQYVDSKDLSDKKMFYGALQGLVASIGDPYTVFMDPKISQDFSADLAGTFEGIGAEIGMKREMITVIAPLPGMPAEKSGIKAGDKIISIDKNSTQGMTVDEAVSKIRGPKNTKVMLTIIREGLKEAKDIEITRDSIVVSSVRTETKDKGVFVIKIMNFNDDTESAFNDAVRSALDGSAKGIILDLRNNPGGYLDTAIEVASEWIEEGPIVSEQYGDGNKIDHLARGRARLKGVPTVVLVNEGSASASEIVSGALQDAGAAKLVGKKTFGKGSVQSLTNLKDGSSIKITIAKWLTPKGRSINEEGVAVDYDIDLSSDDYEKNLDPQMDGAMELLAGRIPSISASASSTESRK